LYNSVLEKSLSHAKIRPYSAKPSTSFGIDGYKVPKSLALYKSPAYSIKKDKSNFFDQETRELRKNPPPGAYEVRKFMSPEEEKAIYDKRRQGIDRNNLPKRPFFMD
jgi:hypothetical protein